MNRHRMFARATVAVGAALLATAPAALATAAEATTTDPSSVQTLVWEAEIDGRDVTKADGSEPIELHPGEDVRVSVNVTNLSQATLSVRSVRLQGRVLGMAFFTFSTRINLDIPAGAKADRVIQLDLSDLGEQAVGLIPARLELISSDRSVIDERSLATQVDGSLTSAYGIFGLAVAAITLVLLIGLGLDIAWQRLPRNRWRRAVRFLSPGLGIGLTATFTVSATRVLLPGSEVWLPLVLGCGLVAFVIGYLTPRPDDEGDDRAEPPESTLPWPVTPATG